MSQEYEEVTWVDETTSTQGTLINAERLNQMQTAHHYADGFKEVDTVPTEDPSTDYHQVVYCTADTTFYRWDGTQWTADIDDDTKRLLLEHEADHNNPHEVTKAQVGLGNCDNTADLDKPISTATQTALDGKADKATTLAGYGITDAVATGGAQTVAGVKTLTDNPLVSNGEPAITIKNTDVSVSGTPASTEGATIHFAGSDGEDLARIRMTKGSSGITILRAYIHGPHADGEVRLVSDTLGSYMVGPSRAYDPANASDIMTIGVFKAQTDTLLATKADKATTLAGYGITNAYTKAEADTLLSAKADTTALTDGSVTKVGTADLGTDTKPIKLVGGVPTAVTDTLAKDSTVVHNTGPEDIAGDKRFLANMAAKRNNISTTVAPAYSQYWGLVFTDKDDKEFGGLRAAYSTLRDNYLYLALRNLDTDQQVSTFAFYKTHMTGPDRGYNAGTSYVHDVATIATLDAYTPMVRTTGNQTALGLKLIPETVVGTKMVNRVAVTHALEVLDIANPTGGLTYLFHLIVSGRFDLGFMRVAVVINSDASAVTSVTTTVQGIYALSNTRQIVAGARILNGKLRLSLRAKSGNTSISAMPMNCNVDGLAQTMDLTPYGNVTAISNMTGYVEEA